MVKSVIYTTIPPILKFEILKLFKQGGDNRDNVIANKLGINPVIVHKVIEYELKACKSRMRETRLSKNRKI